MLKESYESFPKLIQEMIHEKNVDVEMNHFIQSFFNYRCGMGVTNIPSLKLSMEANTLLNVTPRLRNY